MFARKETMWHFSKYRFCENDNTKVLIQLKMLVYLGF